VAPALAARIGERRCRDRVEDAPWRVDREAEDAVEPLGARRELRNRVAPAHARDRALGGAAEEERAARRVVRDAFGKERPVFELERAGRVIEPRQPRLHARARLPEARVLRAILESVLRRQEAVAM